MTERTDRKKYLEREPKHIQNQKEQNKMNETTKLRWFAVGVIGVFIFAGVLLADKDVSNKSFREHFYRGDIYSHRSH